MDKFINRIKRPSCPIVVEGIEASSASSDLFTLISDSQVSSAQCDMLTDSGSKTSAQPQAQANNSVSVIIQENDTLMPTLNSSQSVTPNRSQVPHKKLKQLPQLSLISQII